MIPHPASVAVITVALGVCAISANAASATAVDASTPQKLAQSGVAMQQELPIRAGIFCEGDDIGVFVGGNNWPADHVVTADYTVYHNGSREFTDAQVRRTDINGSWGTGIVWYTNIGNSGSYSVLAYAETPTGAEWGFDTAECQN